MDSGKYSGRRLRLLCALVTSPSYTDVVFCQCTVWLRARSKVKVKVKVHTLDII